MARSHGSALGYANLYFGLRDQARKTEKEKNFIDTLNAARSGQKVDNLPYMSPDQAVTLQDFMQKRGEAEKTAQQQQGINKTLREVANGYTQPGTGPVRPEFMQGGYTPVQTREFTLPEALSKFALHGDQGLETYDTYAAAKTGADDRKALMDFRAQPGKEFAPKLPEQPKAPQLTGDAQNLAIALGRTPTVAELKEFKRTGGQTINNIVGGGAKFGAIPQGYVVRPTPGGGFAMERIAGHPDEEKEKGRKKTTQRAGTTVLQDIQRAIGIAESNRLAVGAPSLVTKHIPESDAQAFDGFVQSALSNVGLDTLQQMRENSKTGGALGQVPIQQQQRLEQVLGSLKQEQRPEILKDNLYRVHNIYMDIVHGTPEEIAAAVELGKVTPERAAQLSERYQLSFDEFGRPVEEGQVQAGAVEDGYRFLGGNPADQSNWEKVN